MSNETLPVGLPRGLAGDEWGSDWKYIVGGGSGGYSCSFEVRLADGTLVDVLPQIAEVVEYSLSHNGPNDDEIGTELSFYAIVRFADGRWGYGSAWNDYTGWGCQDGVAWRIADDAQALYDLGLDDEGRRELTWTPIRDVCPECGGEGVVDGLIVGDDIRVERCHACHGTGLA